MTPADGALLAHGGGVPEAATVGLPVLLFVVFLLLERRARRREREAASEAAEDERPDLRD